MTTLPAGHGERAVVGARSASGDKMHGTDGGIAVVKAGYIMAGLSKSGLLADQAILVEADVMITASRYRNMP